ncbi:putative aldouronate transport system permease protein [Paenibacillus rhizosphaerae]|uniref:Putative aldouronate transport system permease protein n=1 Tax=Paenibacillus rhizosphaerae TaxID=297318 RepID=A0A839TKI7_9BACL|nr:carbohydrate ABC transporter permease [Paenibacillus rhizosphaerae]MBB3127033.1 putative aldouronate transport system permease protein [Paenibacillus rhizosphaerae]
MLYRSPAYRIFTWLNYCFLTLTAIVCLLPLIHVLSVSLSGKAAASANLVGLLPVDFTTMSYKATVNNMHFTKALLISVERTVIGTFISMLFIALGGYALSKDERAFRGRTVYVWIFLFTTLFGGGMIPSYILVKSLGLMNSIWALILPGAVAVYNMILLMNFFRSVPKELEEAALIDGAGHFRTLFSIYLPISLPAIATLALFTMVGHWNSWFDGMIYMTNPDKIPLATYLQQTIVQQDLSNSNVDLTQVKNNYSGQTIRAAQIFIGALPIILVYPFLQKYFVKGIVIGAVKE